MYEDQLVKVRVLGRFHGFYTVMLTVRAVMTFRSSKVVEMKGMDIPELEENFWGKISTENIFPSSIFSATLRLGRK